MQLKYFLCLFFIAKTLANDQQPNLNTTINLIDCPREQNSIKQYTPLTRFFINYLWRYCYEFGNHSFNLCLKYPTANLKNFVKCIDRNNHPKTSNNLIINKPDCWRIIMLSSFRKTEY